MAAMSRRMSTAESTAHLLCVTTVGEYLLLSLDEFLHEPGVRVVLAQAPQRLGAVHGSSSYARLGVRQ